MGNGPRTPDSKGNQVPNTHRTRPRTLRARAIHLTHQLIAALSVIAFGALMGACAMGLDWSATIWSQL